MKCYILFNLSALIIGQKEKGDAGGRALDMSPVYDNIEEAVDEAKVWLYSYYSDKIKCKCVF